MNYDRAPVRELLPRPVFTDFKGLRWEVPTDPDAIERVRAAEVPRSLTLGQLTDDDAAWLQRNLGHVWVLICAALEPAIRARGVEPFLQWREMLRALAALAAADEQIKARGPK